MSKPQFGDFHSHGWVFRAVFKQDRKGHLLDHAATSSADVDAGEAAGRRCDCPSSAKEFHKTTLRRRRPKLRRRPRRRSTRAVTGTSRCTSWTSTWRRGCTAWTATSRRTCTATTGCTWRCGPRCEIQCIDCHGTADQVRHAAARAARRRTRRAPGRPGPQPAGHADAVRQAAVRGRGLGGTAIFQNSMVEKGLRWEVVQTKDTIDAGPPALQREVAPGQDGPRSRTARWSGATCPSERQVPPTRNDEHELHRLPLVVEPELLRLPPAAAGEHQDAAPARRRRRDPELHAVQLPDAARRHVHARPRRRRDRQPDQPGPVSLRRPRRLATTATASRSTSSSRRSRPRASAASRSARTCRTPSAARRRRRSSAPTATSRRTNDNNAWMAQLLMHGTNYLNFIGKYAWVAAGEDGLFGVGRDRARRAAGGHRQRPAHAAPSRTTTRSTSSTGGMLEARPRAPGPRHRRRAAASRSRSRSAAGAEPRRVPATPRAARTACGSFDIAFIDDKAFSERITTAPVSPVGQKFYVPTKYAAAVAAPTTVAVDPTRTHAPGEQGAADPPAVRLPLRRRQVRGADPHRRRRRRSTATRSNNFLKRELTFNPDGLL